MAEIEIAGRKVGDGRPVFIIAEAGVNHNGEIALARRMVEAAAEAGAEAVKFQTFRAEGLVSREARLAPYQRAVGEKSQLALLKELELDERAHRELMSLARESGIIFLSTAFDRASADLLARLGVPAYKVGSGELTDLPLLSHIGGQGKPVLLSTGMANLEEVREAVAALRAPGCQQIALLHCTSSYPAPLEQCNLRALATLRREFDLPVGYSDHTLGWEAAVAAVALGACIVEKHFTLDRNLPGPDHFFSLEPNDLGEFVRTLRQVEASLGDGVKRLQPSEEEVARVARKSIVAACAIPGGAKIRGEMLAIKRPAGGMRPGELGAVIGRTAKRDIAADELIRPELLS